MSKEIETSNVARAQISEVDFPYCVQMRRGMYISNKNQAVTEIVDNSVDEHFAGRCDTIAVTAINQVFCIQDNGGGIPCEPSKKHPEKTQVELAFTKLHAGAKFGFEDGYGKKTSGMHGVGGSCVQALSKWMEVESVYDGERKLTKFEKGFVTEHTHVIEENVDLEETGTKVTFELCEDFWQEADPINYNALIKRLKQIAYLNPGLTIYVYIEDGEYKKEATFLYPEGLKTYLEELTAKKTNLSDIIFTSSSANDIDMQISLVYTDAYSNDIITFCNNMHTIDNGDHLNGFNAGLNDAINEYMKLYKYDFEIKAEDVKEGLVAAVAVRVADPIFEGQAKTKLKMTSVRKAVKEATKEMIADYLDKNPKIAKEIISKIKLASEARIAAQKARDIKRKNKAVGLGKAENLADCSSKDPKECEIFFVEGDSAGGSAKQGRDRKTQAILPIFGKIGNVEKLRIDKVLASDKLSEISKALRVKVGEECVVEDCKYHKIILMSDADVDGEHIVCLHLTYIYRYMRPLIEAGYVYLACPPLYKLTYKSGKKETILYAYNDADLEKLTQENGQPNNIQRFKGLGEMNPDQLWETTMNPETRKLVQVTIEDAEAAEEMVSLCMSEDSKSRREWIMEYAEYAEIDT